MRSSSHSLDRLDVVFDNDRAVADAGLVLPATLAARLGLEESADELISVGFRPRRKTATLCRRCWRGRTASTTPTSSARGRPAGCWATT